MTGIINRVEGMAGKQLEIALDLVSGVGKIGVLVNASNPTNALSGGRPRLRPRSWE